MQKAIIAAIGPITAGALEAEGKSAEIIPAESTVPALLAAITSFFQNNLR
jgi:uroporphyrinogen-III synthase